MHTNSRLLPLVLSLLVALPLGAQTKARDASADAALTKAIAALGGKTQINKTKTIRFDFVDKLKALSKTNNKILKRSGFAMVDIKNKRVRVEKRNNHRNSIAIKNRDFAVDIDRGKVNVQPTRHFVPASRFSFIGQLLLEARSKKTSVERVPQKNSEIVRLLITREGGEMVQLDVDNKSGFVVRYEGRSPDGKSPMSAKFEDWAKVGSHHLPKRIVMKSKGHTIDRRIKLVEVNGPLSPLFFRVPVLRGNKAIEL